MKIKTNVSLLDYFDSESKEETNIYLKTAELKPVDIWEIGDLYGNGSFQFVKDLQVLMSSCLADFEGFLFSLKEMCEAVEEEKGIKIKKLFKYSIFHVYQQFLFFHDEINRKAIFDEKGNALNISGINELESTTLSGEVTYEEGAAGIDVFNKYGSFILLDKLTGGDLSKHDIYKKLPYSRCFTKLLLDKDKSDFNRKLTEIRKDG